MYMYVCACVCIYICLYVHVYIYIYSYAHKNTYEYTREHQGIGKNPKADTASFNCWTWICLGFERFTAGALDMV